MDTINRLQFRHHEEVFTGATLEEAREAAIKYISGATAGIRDAQTGLAVDDDNNKDRGTKYGYSLFGEPTILRYSEPGGENDPHIILAIGSVSNDKYNESGEVWHSNNRFCIIDIDKVESEIQDLWEEIENIIKSLNIITIDSPSLDLESKWVIGEGIYLSGDVKTAKTHVFSGETKENNLLISSGATDSPDGLFIYVDLKYDEAEETFKFIASKWDGTLKETEVKLPNNYLVSGVYKKQDESLHLRMKNGDEIVIDCEELIAEWGVEGEASKTPIVLTREEVDYDNTSEHHHVEPWQDVLRADVRIADHINSNILTKTNDGRYLYVDGRATNIAYYWNGELSNVSEQLDKLNQIKLSSDNDNIIWNRVDGFFATTKLDYISNKNKLVFTTSNISGGTTTKEIQLNSVELFQNIYYNRATEELVITYKDTEGNLKVVKIPIGEMLDEWEVLSEGHNVRLVKTPHQVSGKDILTADAKIHEGDNNILEDKNHELYVNGVAANIKYEVTGDTTVKDVLDGLKDADEALSGAIDTEREERIAGDAELQAAIEAEAQRAQDAETVINNTIGTGFTDDPHENITFKFEQLQNQVNEEADKLQDEIDRSTAKDDEHDARLDEQQAEIEAVSADSASSLKDIINNDHSIDVDKTDPVRPVIKVNLSEHDPYNTIRLEGDGLYNFVDMAYDPDKNQLSFTRSDKDTSENVTKTFQLNSISIIDRIEYDPTTEDLIIYYHVGTEERTVRINLRGIFNEWEVYNDPESALYLERVPVIDGHDKLSGDVRINSAHTDNILVNEHGSLYVPGAQIEQNKNDIAALSGTLASEIERSISADTVLDSKIEAETIRAISAETALSGAINTVQTNLQTEIERATAAETRIETKLDNEITRSTTEDQTLRELITQEAIRATNADEVLDGKINNEAIERVQADAVLETKISGETAAREAKDTILEEKINTLSAYSHTEDERLAQLIADETAAREAADDALEEAIREATLTFDDTSSIDFTKTTGNVVTAVVKVANSNGNIILNPEGTAYEGLFASVRLDYDPSTNKIQLYVNDTLQDEKTLSAGALLDSIVYDSVNRALVMTYTDANGVQHQISFPVNELFNDWDVKNPSEKSALELTKTVIGGGYNDELSGRVLITDDHDGDGKPDQGSDNIIEIRNNGLYVCGSGFTEVECIKSEVKAFENAVIGHTIDNCGDEYIYEQNNQATYINSATSFNNADFILDQAIKDVNVKVDIVSAKTDCVDNEAKKMYEMLYGPGSSMPDCGEGAQYTPDAGSCVISAATSFYEADRMLGDQICEILEMWVSGMTCTTTSDWKDEGANKKMLVDVRLSHGNNAEMTDEELTTIDLDGDYIDPTRTEFTDTNALRIVCLEESPGGVIPDISSKQNGIYLSNVWDCGKYYQQSTEADEIARAQEVGYKTNYYTDEDASASSYNYMNNVRQNDPLG